MDVKAVNYNVGTQKGKKIGTAAGLGAGGAYLLKNRKDIFETAVQQGMNQLQAAGKNVSKNTAYVVAGGVCALGLGAAAVAGRAIGGLIGKVIDQIALKKAVSNVKKAVAEAVSQSPIIKEKEPIHISELDKMLKMTSDSDN